MSCFFGTFRDVDYVDTWRAMENLVRLGLVRSIGISNFNSEQIERLLASCEIKPVNNQVFGRKKKKYSKILNV